MKLRVFMSKELGGCSRYEVRNVYKILDKKPKKRDHLENVRVDGRMILKLIFEK